MSDIHEIRFDTNAEETTRKLDKLEKETKELARAMKGLVPSTNRAQKGVKDLGNAAQVSGKKMNRMTVGLQQAGYQIGDFAVQVQGGTSALLALGQQGPQLLGIFGAGGAISGAALAITTALIAPLMRTSEEAENATGKIRDLISATDDVNSLTLADITKKYGGLTESIGMALQAQLLLNKATINSKLFDVIGVGSSSEGFMPNSNLFDKLLRQNQGSGLAIGKSTDEFIASDEKKLLKEVRDAGWIGTIKELREVAATVGDLGVAITPEAKRELLSRTQGMISGKVMPTAENLGSELVNVFRTVNESVELFRLADKNQEELDKALAALARGEAPGGPGGKPGRSGGGTKKDFSLEKSVRSVLGFLNKEDAKARRLEERKLAQDERIRASLEKSMLTQEEKILLNIKEAERVGATSETIERLNKKLDEARVKANFFATTLGNELNKAFGAVITGASSTKDAMLNMINSILQATAQNTFKTGVVDILTAGVTGLTSELSGQAQDFFNPGVGSSSPRRVKIGENALGGVYGYGGPISAYAKGGVVSGATMFSHGGGLGVMGEAGPEAIMPLKRGANGSLGVVSQGGGSTPVVVNIKNESGGEVQTNQGPNGLDIIIGAVSRDIAAGGKTFNTIRKTFNISPGIQRRA